MKIVGLTGGIASGKSSVANILENCGAVIVDADLLAREVVAPGEPAFHAIVEEFGNVVLRPDGTLDRTALGKLVFADVAARKVLEQITHPRIAERAGRRIEEERLRGTKVLIYVVPLLIEAGLVSMVDEVWLVSVGKEEQVKRLMKRDAIPREEALRKIAAQMPLREKAAYADVIIDNNGLPDDTAHCVRLEWKRLLARSTVSGS
ncbi:MAG: dephospho-CoA kinase [Deltaproteobacteria bacterium]|nr:dephospho-CoA kinase [Deltaproteobacteria bacterium]TLN00975.1 MAG: dephospho-CoA kinase [bacterium]